MMDIYEAIPLYNPPITPLPKGTVNTRMYRIMSKFPKNQMADKRSRSMLSKINSRVTTTRISANRTFITQYTMNLTKFYNGFF